MLNFYIFIHVGKTVIKISINILVRTKAANAWAKIFVLLDVAPPIPFYCDLN